MNPSKTLRRALRRRVSGKASRVVPVLVATHLACLAGGAYLAYRYLPRQEAPVATDSPSPSAACATHAELTKDNVLIKVNEYRLSKGLKQLPSDPTLDRFAQLRAPEVTENPGHQSKYVNVVEWLKGTDFRPQAYGIGHFDESVAAGVSSACDAIEGWKASPTHNDAITDPGALMIGIGTDGTSAVLEIATK